MPDTRDCWFFLGFLVIMLTSIVAGLRQDQGTRLKEQPSRSPSEAAWEEFKATHFNERKEPTERVPSSAVAVVVDAKRSPKAPVFDNAVSDAISQITQGIAGTVAIACIISYVVLLRFDNRPSLSRIVNFFRVPPCAH